MLGKIKPFFSTNSSQFLLVIAFASGFSVMNLEISASRLLAPYFGTSLFVWTNIIGVVLIALSIGYYIGGVLADKTSNIKTLLYFIFSGGLLFLTVPWAIQPLATLLAPSNAGIGNIGHSIFLGSLITSIILFGLPLGLLGMTSPFLIKLYAKKDEIGKGAGSIFAISTIGSILGTFLPTLVFIPLFGTKRTILLAATVLILISLPVLKFKSVKLLLALFLILELFSPNVLSIKKNGTLEETESVHQYIQVSQSKNGDKIMSFDEGLGVQSVLPKNGFTTSKYYDFYNILPVLNPSQTQKKVLLIGLAGGTIARELNHFYGDKVNITAVELDAEAIRLAKKWFDIENIPMQIYAQDGLMFLKNSKEKYDIIIIDAYQNELRIPWTLTTVEFWNTVSNSLNSGGIVGMNINSKGTESPLFKALTETQLQVFPYVYATQISNHLITNFMVTLSKNELSFSNAGNELTSTELAFIKARVSGTTRLENKNNGLILTNDKAPIEFLTDEMLYSLKPY